MSQTEAQIRPGTRTEAPDIAPRVRSDDSHLARTTGPRHRARVGHFARHLVEMVMAMMIGMMIGVGIFVAVIGISYKDSLHRYPTAALLVMAVSMALPMVAWMRFRGHTWRNSAEMGAAMLLPAVPFLIIMWCHVRQDAPNGPYMSVSTAAMLALMLFRWQVYSSHPAKMAALADTGRGGTAQQPGAR